MRKFDARKEIFQRCVPISSLCRTGPSRYRVTVKMARRLLSQSKSLVAGLVHIDKELGMSEVIYFVEPESRGGRWHIKHSGRIRATYTSRAQAIMDARQLAFFENELRGAAALVRVLDAQRAISEDLVCSHSLQRSAPPNESRLSEAYAKLVSG